MVRKREKVVSVTELIPSTARAWKAGKYIYCLSHGRSQVISTIEFLNEDSEHLYDGKKCDWCGKNLGKKS